MPSAAMENENYVIFSSMLLYRIFRERSLKVVGNLSVITQKYHFVIGCIVFDHTISTSKSEPSIDKKVR